MSCTQNMQLVCFPNLKSTPLVDEWFGLLYQNGKYVRVLTMNEVIQKTGIGSTQIPNTNSVGENELATASALLEDVVACAKSHMNEYYKKYQEEMNPLLDEEVDKLIELQEKHHEYYQMTLFEHERKLHEQERRVNELFNQFTNWVKDTLTIQNNPYIRIIAVLMWLRSTAATVSRTMKPHGSSLRRNTERSNR